MLTNVIAGISFGIGCLLVLLSILLSIVVLSELIWPPRRDQPKVEPGQNSGPWLVAVLVPPTLIGGGCLGVFGWFTLQEYAWARLTLEVTYWTGVGIAAWLAISTYRDERDRSGPPEYGDAPDWNKVFEEHDAWKRAAFKEAMRFFACIAPLPFIAALVLRMGW